MPGFFEQKYRVRYSDAGISGFLRPWVLFNMFQDTASVHAWNEEVSALHMAEKGLAWVVRAYTLEIKSLPVWNDEVRIKTWRFPHKNLYELRAYEVKGSSGQIFAQARSAWVLVKIDTGQPVRLGKNMPLSFKAGPEVTFDIPEINDPEDKIPDPRIFNVHTWDIDYNRHANNAVFIKWLIESLPDEFPETTVTGIDAVFMRSAYMGDRLECLMEKKVIENQNVFTCMISLNNEDSHSEPRRNRCAAKAEIRCMPEFMPSGAFGLKQ